jgi:hypothetical protein
MKVVKLGLDHTRVQIQPKTLGIESNLLVQEGLAVAQRTVDSAINGEAYTMRVIREAN